MQAREHLAAVAFTYAWWLTGDEEQAAEAVRSCVDGAPEGWAAPERLPELLRAVRAVAAPTRTMCPASELALLHDGQGLALDRAAAVSEVPAEDARTELAHGRLEALVETVTQPFAHPERLGGLAVGNPPDVAHARTCASCADAAVLVRKGREELLALPRIAPPVGLLEARGSRTAATTAPAGAYVPARVIDLTDVERAPLEGGDLDAAEADPADRRLAGTVLAVLVVLVGLAILGFTALSGEAGTRQLPEAGAATTPQDTPAPDLPQDGAASPSTPDTAPTEATEDTGTTEATQVTEATGAADPSPPTGTTDTVDAAPSPDAGAEASDTLIGPQVDGFVLTEARLVAASEERGAVGRSEPVRVAVDYERADQVPVEAVLDVADGRSVSLRVVLTGDGSSHVFVWQAPTEGWPPGPHTVRILAEDAVVGVVQVPTT